MAFPELNIIKLLAAAKKYGIISKMNDDANTFDILQIKNFYKFYKNLILNYFIKFIWLTFPFCDNYLKKEKICYNSEIKTIEIKLLLNLHGMINYYKYSRKLVLKEVWMTQFSHMSHI